MRGSLRLFGNGGMFSITGLYRNRALGNYRAFVTDLKKTVVLRFMKRNNRCFAGKPGKVRRGNFAVRVSHYIIS